MVALANAIMTSSMVVCDVITARYQRYSFRGSVLVALAFTSSVNAVNCVKLSNHYLKSIERQRYINIYYICTMDNSIEITLKDAETEKEFKLRLSPTSAFKAETDLNFATTLLNVARQGACFGQNSACSETEHMQTTISYDTPLEEASGYQILMIYIYICYLLRNNLKEKRKRK
ncbi:uncharacterized protein [Linepithema humile]|uniref:uncharacterized protein isoform X2 n=1 Tax=Linepithema humile TaxID=83485 RepID=UPI00351EC8DA